VIPLARPVLGAEEEAAVVEVLRSRHLSLGPRVPAFEQAFAARIGANHACAVSSGTAALHLALMAAGVGPGDEVVTSPFSFVASANAILYEGARPVFADIDPVTWNLDPAAVEQALTPRTRMVIPVHFAGQPADLDAIRAVLRKAGREDVTILEDAAHAAGASYKGRPIGACTDNGSAAACFSFHPIKNMTTGEGGMLTLSDPELARKLRALRFHGLEKQAWNRYAEGGTPQVEIVLPGFKYNFMDIQAALGIHQLASVDEFNAKRRELAMIYHELFAEVPEIGRPGIPAYDHFHTWHLYVVKVLDAAGISRDAFMAALRQRNVGTGLHFRAVHTQPYYAQKYPQVPGSLPKAEWASERICSLPLFPDMTEDDVRYVVDAIKDVLVHAKD